MSSVHSHDSTRQRVAPADITLTNWPLRDQMLPSILLAVALVGLACGVSWVASDARVGGAAGAALFVATWRWWIPVAFTFNPAGISQTMLGRTSRKPWSAVACYRKLARGVLLLPDADDSAAATFRGRYVAWRDRRDDLLGLLEFYVGQRAGDSRSYRSTKSR